MAKKKYEFIKESTDKFGEWRTADGFKCYTDNRTTAVRWYKKFLEEKRIKNKTK